MKPWAAQEDAFLREWYGRRPLPRNFLEQAASLLGRTKASVACRVNELGIAALGTDPYDERGKQEARRQADITPEERKSARSASAKARIAKYGHPRGMLGKRQSPAGLAALAKGAAHSWSEAERQSVSDRTSAMMITRLREHPEMFAGGRPGKGGRRADLDNRYFRSRWEANYARWLNVLVARGALVGWGYEVETFWFEGIKRGSRSYTPDFRLELPDGSVEWHEVKGYMDAKSKTKIGRFHRYYPKERLVILDGEWFEAFRTSGGPALCVGWET